MSNIPDKLREQVTLQAKGLCEYCQTAERVVMDLEVDHIIPVSKGGKTDIENLCLCCGPCNGRKKAFLAAFDPETNEEVALFNPRVQNWVEHFQWSEDGTVLIGLTPIGRATIERLGINREKAIRSRRVWVDAGLHPPK